MRLGARRSGAHSYAVLMDRSLHASEFSKANHELNHKTAAACAGLPESFGQARVCISATDASRESLHGHGSARGVQQLREAVVAPDRIEI